MELLLEVISYKGLPVQGGISACFSTQGGTIGRSSDNQLALPDQEKFISRHHASIYLDGGVFMLRDISSGGTWLCREQRWLNQERTILSNGDRIKIGDYELLILIEGFAQPPIRDHGKRPIHSAVSYPESHGNHPAQPPLEFAPQPSAMASKDIDLDELFFEGIKSKPLQTFEAAPPVEPALKAQRGVSLNQISTPRIIGSVDYHHSLPVSSSRIPIHGDARHHPIPQPGNREAALFKPVHPHNNRLQPQRLEVDQRSHAASKPVRHPQPATANPVPVSQKPRPVPPLEVAAIAASETDSELFQAFLQGAGMLSLSHLSAEEQKQAMQAVGVAYRAMIEGLMQTLNARKMEKSMIALRQADVTMVQPRQNNPLKVFPTAEETLREMICQNNPAYIESAQAVKEGFADIMKHQIAMRAGMRAAMDNLLQRIDPQSLEQKFNEGIVFQKKAKCWDAFCEAYPKLVDETLDDLFGDAFAEAYREQLKLFRSGQ